MLLVRPLRALLESRFGAPIRTLIDFREYRRAQRVVSEASEKYGWTPLQLDTISAIRQKKSSDTLYILGSGSSVNQLSSDTWAEIAKHVSVGINHWTLHQFVPDIYAIETVPDRRRGEDQSSSGLEIDHLNHLRILDRPEVIESDTIVICLAPRSEGENSQVLEMPEEMKARTFVYYRFTPFTRREANVVRDYGWGLDFVNGRSRYVVAPDSGASLIRLLGLALKTGFEKVVLVGIDLSTTYFWEEDAARLVHRSLRGFAQPMVGNVHETVLAVNRPFSVVKLVEAYRFRYSEANVRLEGDRVELR